MLATEVTTDAEMAEQPVAEEEVLPAPPASATVPRSRTRTVESPIPEICKTEPCCLGIDEAGRGPVLGPMVYGTTFCPISRMNDLKKLGFADSKQLKENERDDLFDVIKANNDYIGWNVRILTPQDISGGMLRRAKYNLNDLSHDTAMDLIRLVLSHGVDVQEVYVDTVGDPAKYQAIIAKRFPSIKTIRVEKKADSKFPVVSAASICAKVTRDDEVRNYVFEEMGMPDISREFGSGYPGDGVTKAWLNETIDPVFGFTGFVRFSWSTAKKLIETKCVDADMGEDSDDDNGEEKAAMQAFLSKSSTAANLGGCHKSKAIAAGHRYFVERNLMDVVDL